MKLTDLAVPQEILDEGVWVDSPNFGDDGIRYRVRSRQNPDYQREHRIRLHALQKGRRTVDVSKIDTIRLDAELVADTCVRAVEGFDDFADADFVEMPGAIQARKALRNAITDPTAFRVRDDLLAAVDLVDNADRDVLEGITEN